MRKWKKDVYFKAQGYNVLHLKMAAEKALSKEYQRKNTKEKEQKIKLSNISHSQLFT